MAYLVCYSKNPPTDHTENKAIYLDQQFYAMIVSHCRSAREIPKIIHTIGMLKYKSPTVVLQHDQISLLEKELGILEKVGLSHPQIKKLEKVCQDAIANDWALTVSGDMYPELQ